MTVTACIALGSNLGQRENTLRRALQMIDALPQTRVTAVSRFYQTDPVDSPPNSPTFINAAAIVQTGIFAEALIKNLLDIEQALGRHRDPLQTNAPRIIDLDLLLYGDAVIQTDQLTVPHPRMHRRLFVLEPLAEIAPEILHPVLQKTIRELLTALKAETPRPSKEGSQ